MPMNCATLLPGTSLTMPRVSRHPCTSSCSGGMGVAAQSRCTEMNGLRYFRYLLGADELMLALHLASELRCLQMCHMFINSIASRSDTVALYLGAVAEQLCARLGTEESSKGERACRKTRTHTVQAAWTQPWTASSIPLPSASRLSCSVSCGVCLWSRGRGEQARRQR